MVGAGALQCARSFLKRGARGRHVVYKKNVRAAYRVGRRDRKAPRDVRAPRFVVGFSRLSVGGTGADERMRERYMREKLMMC